MRVNLEWLREWVDFDLQGEQLAEQLTIGGLEVDSVEPIPAIHSGIVVAEVLDTQPHPNAERLNLCTVTDGVKTHPVVCGAPNVSSGLKAAFAPVGSTLPDGRKIETIELRGVASEGMLCSEAELGLSDDAAGLLELDFDAPVGSSISEYLRLDDMILDIDLTPNRGDCFSVLGVARETAALSGALFELPQLTAVPASIEDTLGIELTASEACPRLTGRVIRNVATDRISPLWMRERLRRAGLRPIHPIVDVTNYVMLELGQPLHSYDLSKLAGEISVRFAEVGEKLTLLDGNEIKLKPNVLVIADDSGAIGMAGIMGGEGTSVELSTRDVFLEAAFFSPGAIMGRARSFGLHTDASLRFERGVDPKNQTRAIERATRLLLDITGGDPGPVMVTDNHRYLPKNDPILLRHERLQAVLGMSLKRGEVEESLGLLEMEVEETKSGWSVLPPSFRFDLSIEEDLIEEIGRIVGYDTIPATPEACPRRLGSSTESRVTDDRIVDLLVDKGYCEVITYSFVDEELEEAINPGVTPVRLANPISQELGVLRRSLWPGLLVTAKQNLSRQQTRLRLLEIGTQFAWEEQKVRETSVLAGLALGRHSPEHWGTEDRQVDFFDVKGDLEAIFNLTGRGNDARFIPADHPALMPGQSARILLGDSPLGWIGALHPALEKRLELKTSAILFSLRLEQAIISKIPAYQSFSKYPSVRRDLALVLDEKISSERVLGCVRDAAGELLQDVTLFDLYRGTSIDTSRKSMALGLIFQHSSRTLTDADADRTVGSVVRCLEREIGATIRR
jgi:phenylalanyl-tRNA synthetase beta chain